MIRSTYETLPGELWERGISCRGVEGSVLGDGGGGKEREGEKSVGGHGRRLYEVKRHSGVAIVAWRTLSGSQGLIGLGTKPNKVPLSPSMSRPLPRSSHLALSAQH